MQYYIKALNADLKKFEINNNSAAYLQVRDISENQNEKVFIFNGWTFSSYPSLTQLIMQYMIFPQDVKALNKIFLTN